VTYTPNNGFVGTVSFTYRASDGLSQSNVATVTVQVVNRAPVAANDNARTNKGTAVTIPVLANDTDADGDTLTVTGLVQPANGTVVINANGTVTYTPKANFVGTESFTYKASDGSSQSNTATVTIAINSAPVSANDSATTNKGVPVTIAVLANDTDANGDALSVTSLTQPSSGSVALNANGTVTYTPLSGFVGTVSFTYKASDGLSQSNTATVTIKVNGVPVASNDTATTNRNTPVTIPVLANDTDPNGDPLTVAGLTQPASGGSVVLNANGTVTYTPPAGFTGTATFTYQASDGTSPSNTATVTVQVVAPLNTAPVAVNDSKTTTRGTPVSIAVLANDTDANGDVLSVNSFSQPANGTVTFANGIATYTPRSGFTGTDTFTYVATDGQSLSNVATVTVQVNPKLTSYARTTAQSIPDEGVLTSTIVVSDSYTIADINLTLDITHTRVSDLQIFLRGPDGTVIQLFSGTGVSGQNLHNTVFDDEAATSITTAAAPFTGTFRPLQSLSAFDGKLAAGTWTLEVRDTVKKQTGTLNSWSLGITG
jgi:subtilisin-like proprotein convertase family protein